MSETNEVIVSEETGWEVHQHLGRATVKLAGPGTKEAMLLAYEAAKKNPKLEGSIILQRPDGQMEKQSIGMVSDRARRGLGPDGKPYEPELVEVGHKPKDLSYLSKWARSIPETDPDIDPTPTPPYEPPKPTSSAELLSAVQEKIRRSEQLEERLVSMLSSAAKPEPEEPKPVETWADVPPPWADVPSPTPQPSRVERMAASPCGGRSGLTTFFIVLNSFMSRYQAEARQVHRRRSRFLFELGLRLVSGAPVCGNTVKSAYVDANSD